MNGASEILTRSTSFDVALPGTQYSHLLIETREPSFPRSSVGMQSPTLRVVF